MKNILIIVTAFIALTVIIQWMIGPICETLPTSLSMDIAQLPRDGTLQLSYNTGKGYSDSLSTQVQVKQTQLPCKIVFQLPAGIQPIGLRINLHEQKGDIELNGIYFGYYHWGPSDIKGNFVIGADIGTVDVNDRSINIHAIASNPYFSSAGDLDYVYSYLATRAAVIRAAVFLLGLLAFFITITLLDIKGRNDRKSNLSILRLSIFYCVSILLLVPSACTILNVLNFSKIPVFVTSEKKLDIPQFDWDKPVDSLKNSYSYFDQAYAFRALFIRWYSTLSVRLLYESPLPSIIAGKDGWLFYNGNDSLDDHLGVKRLNQKELKDIKLKWTYIKNYLDSKGIDLLLVVAPDKETVYPEFVPTRLGPFAANTRLDQVVAELSTVPGLQYIDLRSTLKSAKGKYPLYSNDGSHWNGLGAFIGYQEITRRLSQSFEEVNVPEIKDVSVTKYIHGARGISSFLIMRGEFPDSEVELTIQPQYKGKITTPRLLIFHDSFFQAVEPFFRNYFNTVVSAGMWQRFDPAVVEREHPDAVIFVMVERCYTRNLLQ